MLDYETKAIKALGIILVVILAYIMYQIIWKKVKIMLDSYRFLVLYLGINGKQKGKNDKT